MLLCSLIIIALYIIWCHLRPIEVENSWLAERLQKNIVLYPFVLYIGEPSERCRRHEFAHVAQIHRDGILKFYSMYLVYYLILRTRGMSHNVAYLNIPYEVEAYRYEKAG